jgi:hypothetical protein
MVVADRTSLPAFVPLVQFVPAGVEFEIHSPIAEFVFVTAVRIALTDTHSFDALEVAAFSSLAGIIDITRVAHVHRLWGIASSVLALPTLALMSTADRFASLIVVFERQTGIFYQVNSSIAVLPVVTICVLFAAGFSTDHIIGSVRKCKSALRPGEPWISHILIVIALQLQLSNSRVDLWIRDRGLHDLEVQVGRPRTSDMTLVPKIVALLDTIANLPFSFGRGRTQLHMRILGPFPSVMFDPDEVVKAFRIAEPSLRMLLLISTVLDVHDLAIGCRYDPIGSPTAPDHVDFPRWIVILKVPIDVYLGPVSIGNPIYTFRCLNARRAYIRQKIRHDQTLTFGIFGLS